MKPKVLFIMHMPPPVHGAAMMGQYIHDSKVINDAFDCRYINPSASHVVAEVGKVSIQKLRFMVSNVREILRTVRTWKPDLCYYTPTADGYGIFRDLLVISLLKAAGQKVVLHMHNKGVKRYAAEHLLARLAYRHIFKRTKVILLAEVLYDDIRQYASRENVFICPNGIPETLNHEPQAERNNAVPHLFFLSNLLKSKGVLVLLDALKLLKDKGYSFVCDFVGGETAEIDAARFAEEAESRGLNRIAIYHGKKYGNDKEEFFSNADIFVFPTFFPNETFGLVNLEAMEHKLPVISTDEGGIRDVVKDGENGLIALKENPESLTSCIETLLGDKQLRMKMGEDGYKKFKQYFTLPAFEQQFSRCVKKSLLGGVKCSLANFYGRKYGVEKEVFFQNADIFVFPTFFPNECFPLVLLEAMQHALPCITTREGAIPDIIADGKNGVLTQKNDPSSLAESIATLIDHPTLRQKMGKEGRRTYQQHLTLDTFEQRMCEVLTHVLAD